MSSNVKDKVEIEAFFYIVIVLTFYATSIVLLLIKYARNDDEEVNLKYQYSEFVKRERFQTAQYKNMIALQRTKALLNTFEVSDENSAMMTCPVIIVSEVNETQCVYSGNFGQGFSPLMNYKSYSLSSFPNSDLYSLHTSQSLYFEAESLKTSSKCTLLTRKRCLSV